MMKRRTLLQRAVVFAALSAGVGRAISQPALTRMFHHDSVRRAQNRDGWVQAATSRGRVPSGPSTVRPDARVWDAADVEPFCGVQTRLEKKLSCAETNGSQNGAHGETSGLKLPRSPSHAASVQAKAEKDSASTPQSALLPWPDDLAARARQAQRQGEPLVLMVSLPGCPWCALLRRNYLMPMRSEGLAAFECMITEQRQQLVNFQGQRITPAAMSQQMHIKITPTVLFFNAQGQEIAPRIEGVASADFIGAILEERLTAARERVKAAR